MSEKTILLVDNEPNLIRSLSYVLEREGYAVVSAAGGREAMEKIQSIRPVLVFLDLMIHPPDGLEICRWIKSHPELRSIRVIILTARTQKADRLKGFEAGADEFMTKPFSPVEVIKKLREFFGTPDPPGQ